jgi:glycosyltransferase involved in cell wall biosynthesis
MQSDLVSIIIPAFNAEMYIEDCLNSVINQTYQNIEIIVVNDGSTDLTLELVNSFNDPRIILINQENKGCSASKNQGLRIANGDFIQYLDADDFLSSDKIEKQVNKLRFKKNSTAVCKTVIISDNDEINGLEIDTDLIKCGGNGKDFLLSLWGLNGRSGMVQPNAYLISKSVANEIGEWNEDISPSPDEDGEYFARVLLATETVYYTEGVNYYRKMSKTKSLSQSFSFERALNLLDTVELKFSHLFKVDNTKRVHKLYQLSISQVAYQFGVQYPKLVDYSLEKIQVKRMKTLRIRNPWLFMFFSYVIGFKNTLLLKRLLLNYNRTKVKP